MDATRLAGFVATGFVLLGVVFSLLLPKTQMHREPDREPVPVDEDPDEAAGVVPEAEPNPA